MPPAARRRAWPAREPRRGIGWPGPFQAPRAIHGVPRGPAPHQYADQEKGAVRPKGRGQGRHLPVWAHGLQRAARRQPAQHRRDGRAAPPSGRLRVQGPPGPQLHRRRRPHHRGVRARRPARVRDRRALDQGVRGDHRRPRRHPARHCPARERPRPRDARAGGQAVRRRPGLPVGRGRLLLGRQVPRVRQALRPRPGRRAGRRQGRGQPRQARPARLRPVEGRQAGRAHLELALGARPAGLAPRVLGDVLEVPRPGLRHPRRRRGPDLPASRERDRPVRGRHRRAVRALLAAQRLPRDRRREDGQVRRQRGQPAPAPGALPRGGAALRPDERPLPEPAGVLAGGPGGFGRRL